MIAIVDAASNDFEVIREIAYKTWPDTYGAILSKNQLDYMLHTFYSENALKESVSQKEHQFVLAKEFDECLGFASYEHNYNNSKQTKIHKIYILPHTQGKGIGKALLNEIEKRATSSNALALILNVNRFNKALGFYENSGFQKIGEEDIELEHGYLMQDYIMKKIL